MKAPKKYVYPHSEEVRFDPPDKEWLEHQYRTLEKSLPVIAQEVGATHRTVLLWMRKRGMARRTRKETDDQHSRRMGGAGNPAWKDGRSLVHGRPPGRRRLLRKLWAAGRSDSCAWCGHPWEGKASLHVHHKDHDKQNGQLGNLQILCDECHRFETHLWVLIKAGKVEVEACVDGLKLTFPYLRDK